MTYLLRLFAAAACLTVIIYAAAIAATYTVTYLLDK